MPIPLEGLYLSKPLVPGKIPRSDPRTYIRTLAAGAAGIPMGRGIQISSVDPNLGILANSESRRFAGVSAYHTATHESDKDTPAYACGSDMGVVTGGPVMVYVEEAIALGDGVRVRITASGNNVAGSFCKTSDSGKTILLNPLCAEWRSPSACGVNETGLMAELWLMEPFTYTAD
jgi:hypothetical protein